MGINCKIIYFSSWSYWSSCCIGSSLPKDNPSNFRFRRSLPDNWTWIRIKSFADISAGGTPDRGTPSYWNGNIPWLKISDITSSNKYVKTASEFITELGLKNSSAKVMPKGTILYTIFATIGEVGILSFESACNQAIAGINTYYKQIDDYLKKLKGNK